MKVEKIEVFGIDVKNLEKAMTFFSEVFNIEFQHFRLGQDIAVQPSAVDAADAKQPDLSATRIAIDKRGFFELIETKPEPKREGNRNIHFKVSDMDEAKTELQRRGVRVVADHRVGGLREVILHPDDVFGIRLCLIEYNAPTMIEALMQGRKS
ncbi:MAG: VOC family protein [Pseudomonadota bacterium]